MQPVPAARNEKQLGAWGAAALVYPKAQCTPKSAQGGFSTLESASSTHYCGQTEGKTDGDWEASGSLGCGTQDTIPAHSTKEDEDTHDPPGYILTRPSEKH
ncbi:hypothetical protein NDU88_002284 [Pleurodeles waltl]|uniref:Uncharacterized protein n=1 Tax=Pleurodeles waltl TaxID=8319 RepID=A0AAV7W2F2_PLEWA|nr:hypothetical protein NDU88_002284 [Pleurodeles waltl]